jgi:SAM-dependent methyltransferase
MDDMFNGKARLQSKESYKKIIDLLKESSIVRALQYIEIMEIEHGSKIIDIGGGDRAKYKKLLKYDEYHSINIIEDMDPTWLLDSQQELPKEALDYDLAISFNTLEHIFSPIQVIKNMYDLLKDDGKIVIITPFLIQLHACPYDFGRPTANWYFQALKESGFKDIQIIKLGWGPFTHGFFLSGLNSRKRIYLMKFLVWLDLKFTVLMKKIGKPNLIKDYLEHYPLSFLVKATK